MPVLPWENGTMMPWDTGKVFIGPDGYAYQMYRDNSGVGQATGYVIKRFNPSNPNDVSYSAGNAPYDPNAEYDAIKDTPLGIARQKQLDAITDQTRWTNDQEEGKLDLARERLRQERDIAARSATSQEQRDRIEQWYKYQLIQNARIELGTRLRGPENHFFYQEAAARGRANPIGGGVASWFNPNSNQVTGTGAWGGGDANRGSLDSTAQSFGAGSAANWFSNGNNVAGGNPVNGNGQNDRATLAAMDEFFKNPQKAAPGFLESKNPSQLKLIEGAADYLGHDFATVASRYGATRPRQGLGSRGGA